VEAPAGIGGAAGAFHSYLGEEVVRPASGSAEYRIVYLQRGSRSRATNPATSSSRPESDERPYRGEELAKAAVRTSG
jgi:hypothetical protein